MPMCRKTVGCRPLTVHLSSAAGPKVGSGSTLGSTLGRLRVDTAYPWGSRTAQAVLGDLAVREEVVDRVVDTLVAASEPGVSLTHPGDEHARLQLPGKRNRGGVRSRGVTGRAHHNDRRCTGRVDLRDRLGRAHRPVGTPDQEPGEHVTEGRRRLLGTREELAYVPHAEAGRLVEAVDGVQGL